MAGLKDKFPWLRWAVPGIAVAALVSLAVVTGSMAGPDDGRPTVRAAEGDLAIVVNATAQLDARQSVTLASELPSNSAKLVWLLAEGSTVKKGDPVAAFDPAPFEQELAKLERDLTDAKAALLQAEAELQLQIRRGRENKDQLEHAVAVAGLKLRNTKDADRPLRLEAARNDLVAARSDFERMQGEREAQQQMLAEGFGNENMVREAKAAEAEAANALQLAERNFQILRDIALPGEVRQAELELTGKRQELEHEGEANQHNLAKQNAGLMRAQNAMEGLAASVERGRELLARTKLQAPVNGFVVHKKININGEFRKAQVGDSVWNRAGFIVIPDMSALTAMVNVEERQVGKVAPGQTVALRPEAYAGLELHGRVEAVGALAAGSGTDNLFEVRIAIEGTDPRLRPGMRARAAILTREMKDVLRVPVESVFYEGGRPVVYVWSWGRARRHEVTLGESNGELIVVSKGLDDGDRVMLSSPLEELAGESAT